MASVFPRISIRRSIEDLAFSSCGRWRMDFMQNFTLNITVLVFAPGLLNQNIWRRKSASTRTSVRTRQENFDVASILPFIRKAGAVFDDRATQIMGEAFDTACKDLHDTGQPPIIYEVIAKRIINAAKNGQRDPVRLRNAGLSALGFNDDTKRQASPS